MSAATQHCVHRQALDLEKRSYILASYMILVPFSTLLWQERLFAPLTTHEDRRGRLQAEADVSPLQSEEPDSSSLSLVGLLFNINQKD